MMSAQDPEELKTPGASSTPDAGSAGSSGAPAETTEGPAWYVVHCYSGYENKVRHNLEQRIETMGMKNKIFDVVVPTQEEIEVRDGKRRVVERHIFPGYVLVNMILTEESWYVVRNTPGVTGFVGMGNQPTPLRPEEVNQIFEAHGSGSSHRESDLQGGRARPHCGWAVQRFSRQRGRD